MNKITIEGNTPHETIATMVALAAPHLDRARQDFRPGVLGGSGVIGDTRIGVIDSGSLIAPSIGEPQQRAHIPVPQPTPAEEAQAKLAQQKLDDEANKRNDAVDAVEQPEAQAGAEMVEPKKPRGRGKALKGNATTVTYGVVHPDGNTRVFATVGEALEAMADFLDVCDTEAEVTAFVVANKALLDGAGHPGIVFAECAADRVKDILTPAAANDAFPASDQVGAKPVVQPAEMDLDLPNFLDRKKNVATESAPPKTIDDVRYAFLALATVKGTDPARLLLDGYQVKRVGELPEGAWAKFSEQCQKKSELDAAAWTAALAQAAAVAKAAQKKG